MLPEQIIATSVEVTPNGGLLREVSPNPLNSGFGIVICPDFATGFWCTFELAAFVKSHGGSKAVQIQPILLGHFFLAPRHIQVTLEPHSAINFLLIQELSTVEIADGWPKKNCLGESAYKCIVIVHPCHRFPRVFLTSPWF